jgi:hypothetical protein
MSDMPSICLLPEKQREVLRQSAEYARRLGSPQMSGTGDSAHNEVVAALKRSASRKRSQQTGSGAEAVASAALRKAAMKARGRSRCLTRP